MNNDYSSELNNAREAISRGDKKTAQQILADILNHDSQNVDAWLLLADILDNPDQRIESLKRVLQISPNNVIAKKRLDELTASHLQIDDGRQVMPSKTSNAPARIPTKTKKTSPIILGLMFIAACVLVILIATIAINSSSLPPHTVNDLYDTGKLVNYYIVVDKSLSKDDAMKLIRYYQGQHSGYTDLNIIFFCDKTYASESFTNSSVPESEIYAHMLYWYYTGWAGTKFYNDITNPDLIDYPTLGSACK